MRVTEFLTISMLSILPVIRQDEPSPTKENAEPMQAERAVEFASPELAALDDFIGPWSVIENHFNPRGELIATVKGTEDVTWILDHRAIRRAYSTATDSTIFKAHGTLTWNNTEKEYQGVWFDNVSTSGPTTVTGSWDNATKTMQFQMESTGKNGVAVRYRAVERFTDPQTRMSTTYLIDGSNLVKRMEVEYKRAIPCPMKKFTIIGG